MDKIKIHWQKCLAGEPQRFEFWAKTADGTVFPKELVINVGTYQGQKVIIAVAREIKERKALEEKLRRLAENDSLTQLYNRRVFFELAEKALSFSQRYNQSLSLILIDIDHFKQINDRLGHPGGDTVLRAFGKFCKENARASDIVARIGGEEFAIVMPNTSLEQSMQWAGLFNDNLSDLVVVHDREEISFSVSMGIATLTEEISTITDLVRMADTALYQAKDAGRDCIKVA